MDSSTVFAFLLALPLSIPCTAEPPEGEFDSRVVGDDLRADVICVNARIEGLPTLGTGGVQASSRVAYVEGFGPVAGLDRWLIARPELVELNLICIELSNSDIDAILQLPRLANLNLRGCRVSNGQLDRLQALASIREVDLHGISVVPSEIARRE